VNQREYALSILVNSSGVLPDGKTPSFQNRIKIAKNNITVKLKGINLLLIMFFNVAIPSNYITVIIALNKFPHS